MASIARDKNGRKRILLVADNGNRKTIRLGKASMKQAGAFRVKLEALIAGRITGNIDTETAQWIAALPETIHSKLAAAGLVTGRTENLERPSVAPGGAFGRIYQAAVRCKAEYSACLWTMYQTLAGLLWV